MKRHHTVPTTALLLALLGLSLPATLAQDNGGAEAPQLKPAGQVEGEPAAEDKQKAPAEGTEGEQADGEQNGDDRGRKEGGNNQPGGLVGQGGNQIWFFVIMIGGFVVLYFFMGRSRRKQQKKRQEMLAALKKGDRVVTIGGIVGNVTEAREDEVMVKVDDNTRMKFARWAIRNVGDEAREEAKKDTNDQQQ
jgi:preprotein translocase subunit YajC